MIIVVSASSRAKECAAAIEQKNLLETRVAASLPRAIQLLETHEYQIIVVDDSFQQVESGAESLVISHLAGVSETCCDNAVSFLNRVI